MSNQLNPFEEAVAKLIGEVTYLQKMLFFQQSLIEALKIYTTQDSLNPPDAKKRVYDLTRQVYDRRISQLEKDDPAYAAKIDMRPALDEENQDKWYFPNPSKDHEK